LIFSRKPIKISVLYVAVYLWLTERFIIPGEHVAFCEKSNSRNRIPCGSAVY